APGEDLGHPVVIKGEAAVVCDFFFVPADQSGLLDVPVLTYLCVDPSCTGLPEGTEPAEGVEVILSDVDSGEEFGACTSEAGECLIENVPVPVVSVLVN